jgi:WD40 repeat protein
MGLKVWSARDHKLERELLSIEGSATAAFSPDGRLLASCTMSECRLWSVGTWEPGPRIAVNGRKIAFAPDNGLLAVETDFGAITLVEPDTGRALATLDSPDQDRAEWIGFSPDATRLLVISNDSGSVHIWDLRRLREQLAPLGLDWDRPPYAPAAETGPAGPLKLKVIKK